MATIKGGFKIMMGKKSTRPKQFLVCFNGGNIFNPHHSWTCGEPCFYTVVLDESLYDAPDYHFLQKHDARCRLWSNYDETGNNKLGEEDLDYKPSKEQFNKAYSEQSKLRAILAEVWAQAVDMNFTRIDDLKKTEVKVDSDGKEYYDSMKSLMTFAAAGNVDIAHIVHLGYSKMRSEWFHAQPEDWANIGCHEVGISQLDHHFDGYENWLLNKDGGINEDGEIVTESTREDWEKFYREWNESFPWDVRQIGDDKDYSKFGKKR